MNTNNPVLGFLKNYPSVDGYSINYIEKQFPSELDTYEILLNLESEEEVEIVDDVVYLTEDG